MPLRHRGKVHAHHHPADDQRQGGTAADHSFPPTCRITEYSYDAYFKGRPNGAFSFVAIRAIEKLGAKGTYAAWFKEIRKGLPSRQYPQSPNLYGSETMKKWKVLG